MILRRATAAALLLPVLLLGGGCTLLTAGETTPDLYQVSPKNDFEPDMPSVSWQLAVEVPTAAANVNTTHINIARTPTSFDYYANSAWTDRAPLMVQTRIVDSFENSQRIVAVSRDSIALRANYVLQPDLRNFEAMYFYGGAPIVHVRIVAKLVRMPDRQIIGIATFERCVRARQDKVPSVVSAFDQALGSVIKRLVSWTLRTPPAKAPDIDSPYDISKLRNPDNALVDSADCPVGNDASNVPVADQ